MWKKPVPPKTYSGTRTAPCLIARRARPLLGEITASLPYIDWHEEAVQRKEFSKRFGEQRKGKKGKLEKHNALAL